MKKLFIVIISVLLFKSIYNYNHLAYHSKITSYRSIPFYSNFYKLLGYEVLSYGCIDVIYFHDRKIRNTSGYLGICSINRINSDIKSLESEEYFYLKE
jgi:hypothetical protein